MGGEFGPFSKLNSSHQITVCVCVCVCVCVSVCVCVCVCVLMVLGPSCE